MRSRIRIFRNGAAITLLSSNGGMALAWLLVLEVVLLGGLIGHLAAVLPNPEGLMLPALASLALMVWTGAQIRSDVRITMDLATRQGRIVRLSPITGVRTAASFTLDEVKSMALRQMAGRRFPRTRWNEYVVAVELRDGERHVLSTRGPLLAYQEEVARFCRAVGLGSRVVRLPAA